MNFAPAIDSGALSASVAAMCSASAIGSAAQPSAMPTRSACAASKRSPRNRMRLACADADQRQTAAACCESRKRSKAARREYRTTHRRRQNGNRRPWRDGSRRRGRSRRPRQSSAWRCRRSLRSRHRPRPRTRRSRRCRHGRSRIPRMSAPTLKWPPAPVSTTVRAASLPDKLAEYPRDILPHRKRDGVALALAD